MEKLPAWPPGPPVQSWQTSLMKRRFVQFLRTNAVENPLKAEFYLPSVPDALIHEGKARVRVLETGERWYGVTYREDLEKVQTAMAEMRQNNVYPEKLW